MEWTEPQIAEAEALYAKGLSYAQIAAKIDRPRSAVASLAYRHRGRFPRRLEDGHNLERRMENERARQAARKQAVPETAPPEPMADLSPDPERKAGDFRPLQLAGTEPVPFQDCGPFDCKLILTDRDDAAMENPPCCGQPVAPGKSYCAAHARLLYCQPGESEAA